MVVVMTWRHKTMPAADTLGILAFDAGKTMGCLVSLYNSLSDEETTKLCRKVIKSKGVAYLNSQQEWFLLNLAAAERLEELDAAASTVSRLGLKCSDPDLSQFGLVYAELKQIGVARLRQPQYGSRRAHKVVDKAEKLVSATANLHAAMESLAEMEVAEKKRQQLQQKQIQCGKTMGPKPNIDYFNEKIAYQRKHVQHFKETSLWEQTFDKTVGIMARLICIVYMRICSVFGAYITGSNNNNNNNNNNDNQNCLIEYRELYCTTRGIFEWHEESLHKRVTKSGPIPKAKKMDSDPPLQCSLRGRDAVPKEKTNGKVLKLAPSSTVGGAGLSVRYANVILLVDRYLHAPATVGEDAREALYEMLPVRLRGKVRAKLRGRWGKEEGGNEHLLAEGWREAVEELMEWLAPVAHDTLQWQAERHLEKARFDTKPTVMLLQTLHYSDLEKAEAAIVEVLVGLSCIYWCEKRL